MLYQLQTGLTAKKRRIAPCWPTRCRLESFYRVNVTNTDTQLIEAPKGKGERGFRWDEKRLSIRIRASAHLGSWREQPWPEPQPHCGLCQVPSVTSLISSHSTLETSCEFTRDRSLGGLNDSLCLLLLLPIKLFGDCRLLKIYSVDTFYWASW